MREGLITDLRTTAAQLQHGEPLPYAGLLLEAADLIAFLAHVVLTAPSAPVPSPTPTPTPKVRARAPRPHAPRAHAGRAR